MIVTGPGSSWITTNIFLIGERGLSNRLEIRDGAYVSNAWYAYIGDSPGESSNAHGNSVLVIEHNLQMIEAADWVIELGPEGGDGGGYVIAAGTPRELAENRESVTGKYLKAG